MAESVISVAGLRKSYGELEAVRGIDLEVAAGEIFAFLGPNGAGKTTTVEILEGYRSRSAGEVSGAGRRPGRRRVASGASGSGSCSRTARCIPSSPCGSRSSSSPATTAARARRRHDRARRPSRRRPTTGSRRLSGGQQRRLDVALALIGDPELLFLDEPTTGFDPSARRRAWEVVASLRDLGKTVFLTTHYMEEAQALADRVAIIAGGEIVAQGSPGELGRPGRRRRPDQLPAPGGGRRRRPPARGRRWRRRSADGEVRLRADDPVRVLTSSRRGRWSAGSRWRGWRSGGRASRTCTWS